MAQGSNLMFSFRSVLFKKLGCSDTPSTFYVVSKTTLYLFGIFFIVFERDVMWAYVDAINARTIFLLLFSSLCFTAANLLSFLIMNRIPIETHAIGNGLRRVFIIMWLTAQMSTAQMSVLHTMGLAFAIISSVLYARCMHFDSDEIQIHELPRVMIKTDSHPHPLPPNWRGGIPRSPKLQDDPAHASSSSCPSSSEEEDNVGTGDTDSMLMTKKVAPSGLPTVAAQAVSTAVGDFDVIEVR